MMSTQTARAILAAQARIRIDRAHVPTLDLDLRDHAGLAQYQSGMAEGLMLAQILDARRASPEQYRSIAAHIALDHSPRSLGSAHVLLDAARRAEQIQRGPRA